MDDKYKTKAQLIAELQELRGKAAKAQEAAAESQNGHASVRRLAGAVNKTINTTERKRSEEALHKTQERLQHVLSYGPATIYLLRIEGRRFIPEWVSESVTRMTGYEQSEALSGMWWADHLHPGDRDRTVARLPVVFTDDRLVLEYRFEHKDGGYLWVHDEMRLLRDGSGIPIEVIGSWVDVTERREAEVALRESEERFRTLVGSIDDIVFTLDREQRYCGLYGGLTEKWGLEREALIGKTPAEVLGAEGAFIHEQANDRALSGEPVVYEWCLKNERGTTYFQNSLSAIRDQSGAIMGVAGVGRDITERKHSEQALLKSQTHLQGILDNCPAIIFLKDLDGRYVQVNRQFERTFNLPSEQALGRTDAELFPPELAGAFGRTDRSVLEAGRPLEFEERGVYADSLRTYILQKFPLTDAAGSVYAIGGVATDITERKTAEDELRRQKEILQKIFDHVPVMIRFLDEDGCIRLVNREWERTLGWSQEEIERAGPDVFAELYPDPEYRQNVLKLIGEATGEFTDLKTRSRDGRVIDTSFANVRLEDGTNVGIGRDITEPKRAADLLRRQTAQLAALHEIGLEISAESELSRILEIVTQRAAELLDASHSNTFIRERDETALRLVASLDSRFIGLRLEGADGLAGRALITGESQGVDDYSKWPGRVDVFGAGEFGPSIAAPLKWQQTVIGAIGIARRQGEKPFTEEDTRLLEQLAAEAAIAIQQATLFDEVHESQRSLQILSHRLIDAQEGERKRLARELHDQIGQALTAVQISLQALQPLADNVAASKRIEDSLAVIDDALEVVHDLSLDLRPSMLDDLGLVAALRWYVDRVTERAGLASCFNAEMVGARLAPEVETACFRIAQEALTNVLRHAEATTVSVQVKHCESGLHLVVKDDGLGFDVRAPMSGTGVNASLGLQGMHERAAALGGVVEIKSKPGDGAEVHVSFPQARIYFAS